MSKSFKIILFGPHGSGKGTQAKMLSQKYNLPVLAVGDIFRKEVKNQTEVGKLVEPYIKQGKLVPNEIVNKIIIRELRSKKYSGGFILDGYPRNLAQLKILEKSVKITHVFELIVSDKEVISRLSGRLICLKCGAIYHIKSKPPKLDEICDFCGEKLSVRDDDKPEAIRKRLEIYHQETEPLLDYYFTKGILIKINGEQPIEKVFTDIVGSLRNYEKSTKNTE